MKNLLRVFSILTFVAFTAALSFTACDDDEDDTEEEEETITSSGTATVGGETYSFNQGILEAAGEFNGVNVYAVMLASDGLDYSSYSGTGDALYLQVNTNSSTFDGGSYTIGTTMEANVIDSAVFVVGIQLPPNPDGSIDTDKTFIPTPGGTVDISKSGAVYDIDYNLPCVQILDGQPIGQDTIVGSYSGELKSEN